MTAKRATPRVEAHKWERKARYEITSADEWDAYRATLAAAERQGSCAQVKERVRRLVAAEGAGERFVTKVLGRALGL